MPAATRRARGTGTISADRGGFRASITISPQWGGASPEYRHRFATREEAEEWLDRLIRESRGGRFLPTQEEDIPTVRAWLSRWLGAQWAQLNYKTRTAYESSARVWIVPCLGDIRLDHLDRPDFRRFRDYLRTQPASRTTRHGQTLAYESQMSHWRILGVAMNAAVAEGVISSHRMMSQDAPRRPATERVTSVRERAMSDADLRAVIHTLHGPRWVCTVENHSAGRCGAMYELRLGLGYRQGEALSMRWENVILTGRDPRLVLDTHALRVSWMHGCTWADGDDADQGRPREIDGQITYACGRRFGRDCRQMVEGAIVSTRRGGGMVEIQGLKSHDPGSSRILALSQSQTTLLRAHRAAQAAPGARFVFGTGASMLSPDADTASFAVLLADAGVPHYRIHDLRHTSVTQIAARTSLADAAAVAGHSSLTTTARYVHPDARRSRAGVQAVSDFLDGLDR